MKNLKTKILKLTNTLTSEGKKKEKVGKISSQNLSHAITDGIVFFHNFPEFFSQTHSSAFPCKLSFIFTSAHRKCAENLTSPARRALVIPVPSRWSCSRSGSMRICCCNCMNKPRQDTLRYDNLDIKIFLFLGSLFCVLFRCKRKQQHRQALHSLKASKCAAKIISTQRKENPSKCQHIWQLFMGTKKQFN